jgi:hypothetical protein
MIAPSAVVPGNLRPVDSPTVPSPGEAPLLPGTPLVPLQAPPAPVTAPPVVTAN